MKIYGLLAGDHDVEVISSLTDARPSFLMVLTSGEFAYRRKDGVLVVPVGYLKD
jgi:hypothetical protein